jgi:2-methylcitrate dehydratase PrpD
VMDDVAFKPYACGTMAQPFIDCAIRLAESGVGDEDIDEIVCEVAEGTVHRLWEPLAIKHRPPTPYAAKFSTPFCIAVGFIDRKAGFEQFSSSRIRDARVLALASRVRYRINPDDEYPRNFSGHVRATLRDGTTREFRQPHMRGGSHAPLSDTEVEGKFMDNARHGGWTSAQATRFLELSRTLFTAPQLDALAEFRS